MLDASLGYYINPLLNVLLGNHLWLVGRFLVRETPASVSQPGVAFG